jgi:hypothetical protein
MTLPPEIKPVPADIYEPHCVMTWKTQIAAMDDTIIDPPAPLSPAALAGQEGRV